MSNFEELGIPVGIFDLMRKTSEALTPPTTSQNGSGACMRTL